MSSTVARVSVVSDPARAGAAGLIPCFSARLVTVKSGTSDLFLPPAEPGEAAAPRFSDCCSRFLRTALPLLASDLLALFFTGCCAVCAALLIDSGWVSAMGWVLTASLMPLVVAYWPGALYPGVGLHPVVELRQAVKVNTVAFLALAMASPLARGSVAAGAFLLAGWLCSVVLVPFGRVVTRKWCSRRPWWGYPALIISSGATTERVVASLNRSPKSGLRPAAVIDVTSGVTAPVEGVRALDTRSVLPFVRDQAIRYAVVSLPNLSRADVTDVLEYYSARIPHLLLVSNLGELPSLWNSALSCGGINGVELRNGLMLAVPRLVKRTIDVVVASLALALSLPLLVAILLLVKCTSRGSAFFSHTRIGLEGRLFRAWKFRTMYCDGDRILEAHFAKNPGARAEWEREQKLRDDPRVTPVGGVLRRLSLDELPQLWNVLRGEMSLVGPRPIVGAEVGKYGKVFPLYTGVKPGISGLWQVSGRNDTTYEQRVALDRYYVRNWSPWLDAYILAKTVSVVLKRQGAY
jgi:Undecaprenyl-phosphate galactose phosphotransferase WbaP